MTRESPATLKTLSRELGLSVTTVSRALKDGPEVRPETIAKVKEVAEALGYKPNLRGIKLKTGKSFAICAALSTWSVGEVGDAGSVALIQGIQSALQSTSYNLIAINVGAGDNPTQAIIDIVSQKLADGIIIDQIEPQDQRIKYLLENDFPFVTYGRSELFTPHPYFDVDDDRASYEATRILLEKGHKKIALFNAPQKYTFAKNRLLGYQRALTERGLVLDESLIIHTDIDARALRKRAFDLCNSEASPTALLSPNEVATLALCAGIRDAKKQPGTELEIISRDGTSLGAYLNPPIHAQFHSLQYTGEKLANFLLKRIEGERADRLQEVVMPSFIDRTVPI